MSHIIYYNQIFSAYYKPVSGQSEKTIQNMISRICRIMELNKKRQPYYVYVGGSDLSDENVRRTLRDALDTIWRYCLANELPWLNTLAFNVRTAVPSKQEWFKNKFKVNASNFYDEYIEKQMDLAEFALQNELIVFDGTISEDTL